MIDDEKKNEKVSNKNNRKSLKIHLIPSFHFIVYIRYFLFS